MKIGRRKLREGGSRKEVGAYRRDSLRADCEERREIL
jgi:hypothetical protein